MAIGRIHKFIDHHFVSSDFASNHGAKLAPEERFINLLASETAGVESFIDFESGIVLPNSIQGG
jgi:hypothetical protein